MRRRTRQRMRRRRSNNFRIMLFLLTKEQAMGMKARQQDGKGRKVIYQPLDPIHSQQVSPSILCCSPTNISNTNIIS